MVTAHPTRRSMVPESGPVFEAFEPRQLLASTPIAVADAHDDVRVVAAEDGAMVLFAQQRDGSWQRQEFGSWIWDNQDFATSSAVWRDPKDGATYMAFNGLYNLWLLVDDDDGRRESVR